MSNLPTSPGAADANRDSMGAPLATIDGMRKRTALSCLLALSIAAALATAGAGATGHTAASVYSALDRKSVV